MNPRLLGLRAILVAGTIVRAAPVLAQSPAGPTPADGLWGSVSVSVAEARLTCDICDPTRDRGPAVEAAFGAYASPTVRVGIDAGGWTSREGDFRERVYTAGVVAEVHPRPQSGLHLIGGLGWSGYRAGDVDAAADEEGFRFDAVRLRLGVGWDLPLTGSWVVGNRVTLDAASLGTLQDAGAPIADAVGLSLVRFAMYIRR